jgi:class I fructose-bisphosphate aldolase
MKIKEIRSTIGEEKAKYLIDYKSKTFKNAQFSTPSNEVIDNVFSKTDRNNITLRNLNALYNTGRLSNTGYLSIFPVDQGIEHSGGASFAKNPIYFDPENIVKLAIEAGCNGVTSTLGALGLVSRKYAHKIPFVVKLNHNDFFVYPNKYDQSMFAEVEQAWNMGAVGVGATVYFGSEESTRQIQEVSAAFAEAHRLGMFTILWCYTRNDAFKQKDKDYHTAADLTGQANHIGVTIEADIIKQKLATNNGGYLALNTGDSSYGKLDEKIYSELTTDHPIDLAKYQVANCYLGKIPLINSGGDSSSNDLADALETAIINKRAGGSGLILGRKAFKKDFEEGKALIQAVQDVYLSQEIDLA